MKLRWSQDTLRDLIDIRAYIREDAPSRADKLVRDLIASVERMGGIKIEIEARARDAFSAESIAGLYAAGCGAAIFGRFYPACRSMITAVIWSGRVAGQNIANS